MEANDSTEDLPKSKVPSYECKICGAPAIHSNYGAITCYPCKMFFKRHVTINHKQLICDLNDQCEIEMNNRHVCSACRLTKCFANGMQSELIRSRLTRRSTTNTTAVAVISNLLHGDNSILTSNQSTILSTLIHSYDEGQLLSIAQQLLTKYDPTLAREFFVKINEFSGNYIRSNTDFRRLSSDDRSIYLRNITENVRCLTMAISWHQSQIIHSTIFLQMYAELYGENSVQMIRGILKWIDSDIIIDKLILSLFAFSKHSSANIPPGNTLSLFQIQTRYVEVIWKYFLSKYGYSQSIERFNQLIQCLLAATMTISELQTRETHVEEINALVEQIELSFILDEHKS